ncbi:hypothetical protein [Nocardiopsis halophila]|uniref:hypothetical protein n=1 Tax=Nocardiopsis halophila TaxID=141692 RepID=UPI00037F4B46|nr:hypothetical protein [Nocardiopsis halophila]
MDEQRTPGASGSDKEDRAADEDGGGGGVPASAGHADHSSGNDSAGVAAPASTRFEAALCAAVFGFFAPTVGSALFYGLMFGLLAIGFGVVGAFPAVLIMIAIPTIPIGLWACCRSALKALGAQDPGHVAALEVGCSALTAVLIYRGVLVGHAPFAIDAVAVGAATAGLAVGAGCGFAVLVPRPVPRASLSVVIAVGGTVAAMVGLPALYEARQERADRRTAIGDTDFAIIDHPEWRRTGASGATGDLEVHYRQEGGGKVTVETWNGETDGIEDRCGRPRTHCDWQGDLLVRRAVGEVEEVRTVLPDGTVAAVTSTGSGENVDLMEPARHVRTGTPAEREEIIDGPEV